MQLAPLRSGLALGRECSGRECSGRFAERVLVDSQDALSLRVSVIAL